MAVAQEFADEGSVSANGRKFRSDLAGTRGEVGIGVTAQFKDRLALYLDVSYMRGHLIEQPYGLSSGVRYRF